jgi:putative inorganic carbon (HCO3(-)) transporter
VSAGAEQFTTRFQIQIAFLVTLAGAGCWLLLPEPYIPLLVAFCVFAATSAVNRPFIICLCFIALSFFRLHEAYPVLYPLHLPLLIAVITIAAVFWHAGISRSITPFWSSELVCFSLFFVIVTVGIAFAINRQLAFDFWSDIFWKIGLMTLVFAWLPRSPMDFASAGWAFVIAGILVALVAIHNKFNGIGLVELTRVTVGKDINSLLGDPNDLALVLLFPLSFSAAFATHRCGKISRLLGVAGVLTILCAIVFTQSRGGLIGVLAIFALTVLLTTRSKFLLIFFGLVAAVLLYDAMGISGRISGGAGEGLDESAADRLDAWAAAIQMALARPLTGVGVANFPDSLSAYAATYPGHDMTAHSTWFSVLGETGFPGLFAFAAMVWTALRSSLRALYRAKSPYFRLENAGETEMVRAFAFALMAGLASFCAAGSFLTQGFTWPIYILVGLTAALGRFINVRQRA